MDFFSKYRPSIIALCEKHKVKWLFAFGSVLTSRFTEKSDIDLGGFRQGQDRGLLLELFRLEIRLGKATEPGHQLAGGASDTEPGVEKEYR